MASFHDDDEEVGFEEGMLLLPSHVLREACGTKVSMRDNQQKVQNHQKLHQRKSSGESQTQYSKSPSRYQRPKLANGGPGMRAFFLESRHGSCGTGVFLPQKAGANFQPNKRPACAPVLLPARVVEALNLNVHALGVQISPSQVEKNKPRCENVNNNKSTTVEKRNGQKDGSKQCSFVSQNQSSSPEIFLPKEWTY